MDLSKLPKLSDTESGQEQRTADTAPVPQAQPAPAAPGSLEYGVDPRLAAGPEAWLSIAFGVILLLLQQRLLSYVIAGLTGGQFTWTFTNETGQPITYTQSIYFMHDLGLVVFALAMVLDGVLLLVAMRRWTLMAGLVVTVVATLWNLVIVGRFYSGYGLQLMPALAVAFGGYLTIAQWRMLTMAQKARTG